MKEQLEVGEEVEVKRFQIDQHSQLTINHQVYFIAKDHDIHAIQHSSTHRSDSDEEAYKRSCKATKEWTILDYGWIDEPSFIAVVNDEKDTQYHLFISYNPSVNFNSFLIPPRACQLFYPTSPKSLHIRSFMPSSKYTLHAFPK